MKITLKISNRVMVLILSDFDTTTWKYAFNGLSGIPPIACQLYYLDIKMLVETNIVLGYQNGVGKDDDCKQSVNNMHHVDNIRYQAMFRDCCLIGMELDVSGSLSLSIERDCELIEGDAFSL